MTYELYIGDRTFSSWSLRGWLMFEKFDLPVKTHMIGLYTGTMAKEMAHLAPARLVPAMQTPEGIVIGETLAMAETLAERHPSAGLWPSEPAQRAHARWLSAEIHAGFSALRGECPMQLAAQVGGFAVSEAVRNDLDRLETLWDFARSSHAQTGPWLFGAYSLADAFYAPVAARIAGYGLPVSATSQAYVAAHLADPAFRRWRALGLCQSYDPFPYDLGKAPAPWPGPKPLAARPLKSGPSQNSTCPYSGKPVSHYLELGGKTYGFCNANCRDKTVNDPEAWPKFMELLA